MIRLIPLLIPRNLNRTLAFALTFLGLNVFVIGPNLISRYGQMTGYGAFIGILVLVIGWLGFVLGASPGRSRFQIIRLVSIVVFIEHVVFKGLWIYLEVRKDPVAWHNPSAGDILFNLLFSFIPALPVVLIIALLGNEAALLLLEKDSRAG